MQGKSKEIIISLTLLPLLDDLRKLGVPRPGLAWRACAAEEEARRYQYSASHLVFFLLLEPFGFS